METILIADDHELIRRGIRTIIEGFPQPYNLIEASTGEAVLQLLSTQQVHFAILDMLLADGNIFFAPDSILTYSHQTNMLVYSAHAERLYARRLLQKGVRGYLCKQAPVQELENAIKTVLNKEIYLSPSLKEILSGPAKAGIPDNPLDALSDRELEVVEYITTGMSTSEIARRLDLDLSTVSTYRRRLFKKLEVQNTIELNDKFLWYKMQR